MVTENLGAGTPAPTNNHNEDKRKHEVTLLKGVVEDLSKDNEKLNEKIKKLEESLRSKDAAIKSKDKLTGLIAHDLRNSFNNILGFSELILSNRQNLNENQIDEYLQNIHDSTKGAHKLTEDIVSWSKSQTGDLESKKLNQIYLIKLNKSLIFYLLLQRVKV